MFLGRVVITGIFKEPVEGQVRLRKFNLDGDKQADLTVHGGADKAIYAYPLEHYDTRSVDYLVQQHYLRECLVKILLLKA